NGHCIDNRISADEKKSIIPMMEKIAQTNSLKQINQVRSMEHLRNAVRARIDKSPAGGFKITRC
ncbi:MAG: hypothetical protein RR490_07300, partial [Niameybacter sp.]